MKKLLILFLAAFAFRIFVSPFIWHPDLNNHVDWGVKFFEYGANKFYAPESNVWAYTWPNQPPGTILIFASIRVLYEVVFDVFWKINTSVSIFPSGIITWIDNYLYQVLLKLPSIWSDLGISYLIYKIVLKLKNKKAAYFGALLFLVNPVIWYNSAIWGQTDAIINFFFLLSVYLLLKKKPFFSIVTLAICLYIKISLLIFVPVYAVLLIKQRVEVNNALFGVLASILLVVLLTIPFSGGSEPISWLFGIYTEKVLTNQLQVITANAFNFWALLTGIYEQPHILPFGGLTYQLWGAILFLVSFIPPLLFLYKKPSALNFIWALSLTAFSSWMLLTNMHERYLYPLFPFFTMIVAMKRSLLPLYVGISGINLVNLYNLWWRPEIEVVKNILSAGDRVLARVLAAVNVVLYIATYKIFLNSKDEK